MVTANAQPDSITEEEERSMPLCLKQIDKQKLLKSILIMALSDSIHPSAVILNMVLYV